MLSLSLENKNPTTIKDLAASFIAGQHGTLDSRVNFTRNTIAHYWDENGVLQQAAADEPRFSYDPATGLYQGLVIMGQWTNEILDPRDMTTGNWNTTGSTAVQRDAIGIDGEANTANTLTGGGAGDRTEQTLSISDNSNTHTGVLYVKKGAGTSEVSRFRVDVTGGSTPEFEYIDFNPQNGNYIAGSGSIEDEGDFWKVYVSVANNSTGNTSFILRIYPIRDSLSRVIVADAAQVFLNRSFPPPTPVFGTTARQAFTQDPDIATITDLSWFNPDEGTFVVEGYSNNKDENYLFEISDGSTGERYAVQYDPSGDIRGLVKNDVDGVLLPTQSANADGEIDRAALAFDASGASFSANGQSATEVSTSRISQGMSVLNIGSYIGSQSNNFLDGGLVKLSCFSRRLSTDQLKQLTS